MASNEVEVLDPAPTVEKLEKSASERVLNRRHFIAALGVAGAAVAGTELVRSGPTALAQQPKPNGYAQVDVLNFLLNIKYLKATLYSYITQGNDLVPTVATPNVPILNLGTGGVFLPPAKISFTTVGSATGTEMTDLFNAMYYDELQDLITLRSILGSAVYPRATMNLLGTGVSTATGTQTVSQVQAISILRMLEDLSASAFAGATIYLTGTNLQYATQALAVNGFHAGALRLLALQTGAPYYSPQDLTTSSAGTQTQNSFTGSLVSGSTTIFNFAPTNPITVGSIITGPNILPNTTVTSVNPVPVYTGSLTGTTATPNNIITNVTATINGVTVNPFSTGSTLTTLQTGMALTGTGIPANAIITAISGTTITLGTITGYTALVPATPPFTGGTPITNGVMSINYSGGYLLTPGTYTLAFSGGGGSGAAGTITVITPGSVTSTQTINATYSFVLTSSGSGYITPPTVTTTVPIPVATGGQAPTLTANVAAQITTTTASVTLTPTFIAATNKTTTLTFVSQTAPLAQLQLLTGTGIPANGYISPPTATVPIPINAAVGTVTISSAASATTTVAPTGFVTQGTSVISSVSSVSGILLGMPITGTGIPAGTTVTSFDPVGLTITMLTTASTTTTGTSSVTPSAFLTKGSNIVTDLSSLTGLAPGNTVTGIGIPANTVIGSVGIVNTATLAVGGTTPPYSTPALASATTVTTAGATVNAILQSGNNNVAYVVPIPYATSFPATFTTGQLITDSQGNIAPNTTITGVSAGNFTIALSAPAPSATTVTALYNFTATIVVSYETLSSIPAAAFTAINPSTSAPYLSLGVPIVGPNIPAGAIINGINAAAGTITINQFPTAALGPELTATSTPQGLFSILATTTLTSTTIGKIQVFAPTTSETVTIPTVETVTPSLGTTTLSQAPIAVGTAALPATTSTLIVEGIDNMDVEPYDPGTAALASAGPQLLPEPAWVSTTAYPIGATVQYGGSNYVAILANTSVPPSANPATWQIAPSVYGGFFDTASASTSSVNNPAGSTFARTFSQVLTVLYGSTTAQTYQGGFFPNGVSGGINFV